MFKLVFKILSGWQLLPVMIFHQVLARHDPLRPSEPTVESFDEQMRRVHNAFNPVDLCHGIKSAQNGELKPGSIAVTFDDGYADNYENAFPVLKKWEIPATFFIASDFLDGGIMWNDAIIESFRVLPNGDYDFTHIGLGKYSIADNLSRYSAVVDVINNLKYLPFDERLQNVSIFTEGLSLPNNLMMRSQEVISLHQAGMAIGGHTQSHPILAKMSRENAKHQIVANKLFLESLIGSRLTCFAYPNGKPDQDYSRSTVSLVKEAGYEVAVSTSPGVFSRETPLLEVPRHTPWRKDKFGYHMQIARNFFTKASFATR